MWRVPDVVLGLAVVKFVGVDLLEGVVLLEPGLLFLLSSTCRKLYLQSRTRQCVIPFFPPHQIQPVIIRLHIPIANHRFMSSRMWQPMRSSPVWRSISRMNARSNNLSQTPTRERQDLPWRGIFNAAVARHVCGDDGDFVACFG